MNLSDKKDKQASQKNPQTKQKPIKHLRFFLVPVNTEERKKPTFLSTFSNHMRILKRLA